MKTVGVFWNINFEKRKATCRFPHLLENRHLLSSISWKALAILDSLHFWGRFLESPANLSGRQNQIFKSKYQE